MTSPPKRHPGVPRFDEALLDRIAVALGRRAKAIKYYADQFACTRETEADGQERLNVDVQEAWGPNTPQCVGRWSDVAWRS